MKKIDTGYFDIRRNYLINSTIL